MADSWRSAVRQYDQWFMRTIWLVSINYWELFCFFFGLSTRWSRKHFKQKAWFLRILFIRRLLLWLWKFCFCFKKKFSAFKSQLMISIFISLNVGFMFSKGERMLRLKYLFVPWVLLYFYEYSIWIIIANYEETREFFCCVESELNLKRKIILQSFDAEFYANLLIHI